MSIAQEIGKETLYNFYLFSLADKVTKKMIVFQRDIHTKIGNGYINLYPHFPVRLLVADRDILVEAILNTRDF